MRVKRPKPDDLIDALKHLKIADRRSRLSLRGGRTTGSFALLGGSSLEQTLRCRMPRSASSNSGIRNHGTFTSYPCDCCCTFGQHQRHIEPIDISECSVCSRLSFRGSAQLAGGISPNPATSSNAIPAGSGFSPFTTSAGLLYSTLPTNLEFRPGHLPDSHSQHVLQSDKLRRSYGAGLSRLDFDPVVYDACTTSATQSRSSFGSVTTSNSDRHHCCVHGGLLHYPPLTHRLYRRLYSLIDHPCVSWYNTSRPLRCFHRTSIQRLGCGLGKCTSHRHPLSLRHRYTTPGSASSQISQRSEIPLPVLPDLSSISLAPQDDAPHSDLTPVNCERSLPDFPSTPSDPTSVGASQMPRYSDSTHLYHFGCDSAVLEEDRPIPGLRRGYLQLNVNRVPDTTNLSVETSPQSIFGIASVNGADCLSSSSTSRCRRNSDPEQWQLVKTMRMCSTDDPCHDNRYGYRGGIKRLCSRSSFGTQSGHMNASSGICRSFLTRSLYADNQRSPSTFSSSRGNGRLLRVEDASVYQHTPSVIETNARVFLEGIDQTSEPQSIPVSLKKSDALQQRQSQQLQIPTDSSGKANYFSRVYTFRPSVLSSQVNASNRSSGSPSGSALFGLSAKACGDSVESNSEQGSKPVGSIGDSASLLWGLSTESDLVTGQPQAKQIEDGTSMHPLQYEIALLESTESSNGGHNKSQLTSDISVNELAAYMEHMVHIPGRMSEMAQRMYL